MDTKPLLANDKQNLKIHHGSNMMHSNPPPDAEKYEIIAPPEDFRPELMSDANQGLPTEVFDDPFTEDDARYVMEMKAQSTWFLRREFAMQCQITSFDVSNAYVCSLETFQEERRIVPDYRPYYRTDGPVDGPHNGYPPSPWEIAMRPPGLFVNHTTTMVLPHTEEVRVCFNCAGGGMVTCWECSGRGNKKCHRCNGKGLTEHTRWIDNGDRRISETYTESCFHCNGSGFRICSLCDGSTRVVCPDCEGECQLVHYSRLDFNWTTLENSKVVKDNFDPELKKVLPDSRLKGAGGPVVLAEEDYMVYPTAQDNHHFRVSPRVDEVCNLIIAGSVDHMKLLHRQRLIVRGLPVYEVSYLDNHSSKRFWVYGTDHQVYAPSYPKSIPRIVALVVIILLILGGIAAGVYFGAIYNK
eukprot:TRINITY_DN2865_c0_g1_i1.p1 TRINITY_DN2865_c0_g1~~TRINITY_DN2865_c0_g1_i1.p1  ORF type:complete len:412 (-),score=78.51 TRINITY_DN2865_c0_g1_i1:68-1303(-)